MEVAHRYGGGFGIHATFERVKYPARGREGGLSGERGRLSLSSGAELRPKGFQQVPPGKRLIVEMPGGGGYGDPLRRDRDKVQRDVLLGFLSEAAARESYGCD
jgi:N-methylhydantoinase B